MTNASPMIKDILLLFNRANNDLTKQKLLDLLSEPLSSQQKIIERQHILKELQPLAPVFEKYNYPPVPLYECCKFLETTVYQKDFSDKKLFGFKLWKIKHRNTYNKLYSSVCNIIVFFFPLYDKYYSKVQEDKYPSFRKELFAIKAFLTKFKLTDNNAAIRNGNFTDRKVFRLLQTIETIKTEQSFKYFMESFILFETYISIVCAIEKNGFVFPAFSGKDFLLKEIYHPVVDNCIKNSMAVTKNVALITGPNMSGKSTLLKTVWLCVYLAHVGVAVPAAAASVPFFDKIFIFIDHYDNLDKGLSHFMTEIKNLKMVVEAAATGEKCFAVFDELFKGTNIEDALIICNETIHGLTKFNSSYFFISTHLHSLDEKINRRLVEDYYLESIVTNNFPRFTFRLKKGWSSVKLGKTLFEQEDLSKLLK